MELMNSGLPDGQGNLNQFGFDLFQKIAKEDTNKNILISSASIAIALAMVHSGAGGETKGAIAAALRLSSLSPEGVDQACQSLGTVLDRAEPAAKITMANAIWVNIGRTLPPEFAAHVARLYRAEARNVDFSDSKTLSAINGYISSNTGGMIKALLSAQDLMPPTDCIITNALYFKGRWKEPFRLKSTRDRPFMLPNGQTKTVPFMYSSEGQSYLEMRDFQAVNLPYGDGGISMVIVLPTERSSLDALIPRLMNENWAKWMSMFKGKDLNLSLPRFSVDYETSLKKPLMALGMGPYLARARISARWASVVRLSAM